VNNWWSQAWPGDEATGAAIVGGSLAEPIKWIAINAGYEGAVMVREVERAKGTTRVSRSHRRARGPRQGRHHRPGEVTARRWQNAARRSRPSWLTTEALIA